MKRVLNITIWIALISGIFALVGFIDAEHKKISCKDVDILIDYQNGDPLVFKHEVELVLNKQFDTLVGRKFNDIDLPRLENRLRDIPAVEKADIYTTITGSLKVRIKQRTPILKLIDRKNENYYVDKFGKLFKTAPGASNRVIVVNGYIDKPEPDTSKTAVNKEVELIAQILEMVNFIRNDDFLNAQIEQIYVTRNREFELVPKVGRQLIIFGGINDMEKKFEKLLVFYRQGINKKGWDQYKTINLKYENQVVCSKN
ncbi:MAG: hypothetical protein JW731_03880 [Bacteroidales bacterium]|nr:hypothetical protein [Bacteroidales bacterium]